MKRITSLLLVLFLSLVSAYSQTNAITLPDGYTYPWWPEYNYLGVSDLSTIQKQPWIQNDHVVDGWDWSFPSFVTSSPRSLIGLQRILNLTTPFQPLNLQFDANSIGILWVSWRDIEPTMDNYDFTQLKNRIEQANSIGSDIILRVLCHARGTQNNPMGGQAPLWLDDLDVDYAPSGGMNINYNPLHPAFHDRYIKLINKLAEEGIPDMVKAAYVGWASPAYGDEGIGPYHNDVQQNAEVPEVIERIDTWATAFEGQEYKVFMGAPLIYGFEKGFGVRRGFVEMYLYQIPNSELGQYIDQQGYLHTDESAPIHAFHTFNGEVNEEYEQAWATEARDYRFGYTTLGFPYRFFISSLRLLQMRCTYVHSTGQLAPQMLPFIGKELGRTVDDAPSVWSFLNTTYMRKSNYANNDYMDPPRTFTQTEIDEGIELKNFERWLYQRDAPGYETTPTVKILHAYKQWMVQENKDYDYIARRAQKMGFDIDDRWVGIEDSVAIKVTYFDNHTGELQLTYNNGSENITKTQVLTGDEGLKTATFFAASIAPNAISENGFDFTLEASEGTDSIVVSMVRVVHTDVSSGQIGTYSLNTTGSTNGSIILDPPGGSYHEGSVVTATAVGDLGFGFDSWGGDLSGTENPVTIIMDSDKTISASFTEVIPVQLTTEAQNGSILMNPPGGVYNPGTEVTLTVEADSGYVFQKWGGDLSGYQIPETIIMDGDKNVTATFIKAAGLNLGAEDGTIYVASDGLIYSGFRSTWAQSDPGNIVSGTNDPELFKTWTVVPRNTDLTRPFSLLVENGMYQVTLMTSEHSSSFAQPGKRVTEISYENTMHHEALDTWVAIGEMNTALNIVDIVTVEDGELNVSLRKVAGEWDDVPIFHAFKAIRINNEQNIYTLSLNSENGTIRSNSVGNMFYEGTEITLTAIPDDGYQFSGWSGDLTGIENPATITIDSDKNITALFTPIPTYTLSIAAENGTVTTNPAGNTYPEGTQVTLTATPDDGYQFSGWSGDLTGIENPATITIDSDKNITALFTPIPTYTLSIAAENGTVTTNPAGNTYPEGTQVTLTATPDSGYQFSGWSGDLTGIENPATITIDSDKDITALFTLIPTYNLTLTAENGTVITNPAGNIFPEGTQVTLAATPDEGYLFDGWTGDLNGTENPAIIIMNSDKNITAEFSLVTMVDDQLNGAYSIRLGQNYPNPFEKTTSIPYYLNESDHVKISVYNFLGNRVAVLVDEFQAKGNHIFDWHADKDLGNSPDTGLYLYSLETSKGGFLIKKLIIK